MLLYQLFNKYPNEWHFLHFFFASWFELAILDYKIAHRHNFCLSFSLSHSNFYPNNSPRNFSVISNLYSVIVRKNLLLFCGSPNNTSMTSQDQMQSKLRNHSVYAYRFQSSILDCVIQLIVRTDKLIGILLRLSREITFELIATVPWI